MKRIAIQGVKGCFHEQAARLFYEEHGHIVPEIVECAAFDDLYRSLDAERADAAVMAIENTVSGGLLPNFELLRKYDRKIKGEVFLRIKQNLMALPGQSIEDIKEVRTHYMAINQTREFFKNCPWIRLVESEDTAKSAAEVAQEGLMGVGAVASELAADLYGLNILAPSIETYKQNFTRFLILADKEQVVVDPATVNKASIRFTLPHTQGSLSKILTVLSFYDINLTKIQSLPIIGHEWEYQFYIDVTFDNYTRYRQSIEAVRPLTSDFSILGEYRECPNPEI